MDETSVPFWAEWVASLGPLIWIVQIGLIVHVFKTGRPYWWCFILFIAPLLGGLAYIFFELLPELRTGGRAGLLQSLKPRSWIIKERRQVLAESDTVENRLTLADELFLASKLGEAHEIASGCLQGIFRDDPHLLLRVVRYKVELGRGEQALELIEKAPAKKDRALEKEAILLRGRACLILGRNEEGVRTLNQIADAYLGEEPRYHLGVGLEAMGRRDEALSIWRNITLKFRKATPMWRRSEKRWYKLANERLKTRSS